MMRTGLQCRMMPFTALLLRLSLLLLPSRTTCFQSFLSTTSSSNQSRRRLMPQQQSTTTKTTPTSTATTTTLLAWFPYEGVEAARTSVPLWFFGAAGSGGVARAAIPGLIDEWKLIQKLKGVGPTKGGPTIGVGPWVGYPEDVCLADLEAILSSKLTVEQIVDKYPIPENAFSTKGYLTLKAWKKANEKNNPLAAQLIFDSFGTSKVVEPDVAQQKLDEYRTTTNNNKYDFAAIKSNVVTGKLTTVGAIIALLFLLGLADAATATDAYRGYFHEWPGGQDFPWSMFTDPEGAPWTIPKYWDTSLPSS